MTTEEIANNQPVRPGDLFSFTGNLARHRLLAQLRSSLRELGRLSSGRREKIGKLIKVAEHEGVVILRADVPELKKHKIRMEVGEKFISIGRRNLEILKIPILGFQTRTTLHRALMEVKLIGVSAHLPSTLLIEAASKASNETIQAVERLLRSAEESTRAIFITRSLNAVASLSAAIQDNRLKAASMAPSDCSVLIRALEAPEAISKLAEEDPLAPAKLRGIDAKQSLLTAEGGTLSSDEVANLLGISRQAVDKRRRAGRLIGLTRGRRGYAYPAWQFKNGQTISGLESVLSALRLQDAWMQTAFMLNSNTRLGRDTPLAKLRVGNVDEVVKAAQSYTEQGAT